MEELYKKAAEIIKQSKCLIALTGAGHSVESGIPDFRGQDGLWKKYDPMKYLSMTVFRRDPEKSWTLISEMNKLTMNAKPNAGHYAMAKLEYLGYLKAVITQNIDGLHQAAGSKNVIEFHGNDKKLECLNCGAVYKTEEITKIIKIPRCLKCNAILKPTVIFFEEMIPVNAKDESMNLAETADAVLVAGTSAQVYPAAQIPFIAKQNNASIIEMNLEETALTSSITDVYIPGLLGTTLPELLKYIEN
jgi:NAD-dependent deacetylase